MRLAYLITVHDQPQQLARLVDAIHCDWARIYIHVDKKADIQIFQQAVGKRDGVRFLTDDRVDANWMGFSLVRITLKLMAAAHADGFDYCTLLSGSDYPIKSNDYLHRFFSSANEEYISFWRISDRPNWFRKIDYFYLVDQVPIRLFSENREPSFWRRFFWGRYFKYQRFMPKRTFPGGLVPYGGPDWWTLSFGCVSHVLHFVDENPGVVRFFRYTNSPGELFFQTVILNSEWADRVHNRAAYEKWRENLSPPEDARQERMLPDESFNFRYVDWSGQDQGAREMPAVLDERDWPLLSGSEAHFARKFHPERSGGLLKLIDSEILQRGRN
jgi:hypothetical protein